MIERKPLMTFLIVAFGISWILFFAPMLLVNLDAQTRQLASLGLISLGMWGPGIGALIATRWIEGKSFRSLRLNTLGSKRMYLWAWLLPPALSILGGLFTILFGVAQFDPDLTLIRTSMVGAPGAENINPWIVVLAQSAFTFTLAPLINILFALGEELGWRGYLLPKLLPLGQWRAVLISGVIWGVWHAPVIVQGQNYPGYPVLGIFMMIVFCILLGTILSWLYLNVRSPWIAALAHGAINASAGLPVLFFKQGFDMAFGGTIATPPAWLAMGLFILWLVLTKRFPVQGQPNETGAGSGSEKEA